MNPIKRKIDTQLITRKEGNKILVSKKVTKLLLFKLWIFVIHDRIIITASTEETPLETPKMAFFSRDNLIFSILW
jgi:hypothetical protein